jgi:uncharacterized protein YdcH (DUF465 family)
MNEEQIKASLMSSNPEFQKLIKEHRKYEGRLEELQALPHMSEEDLLEQNTLKKKKLRIKDRINGTILQFRTKLTHQTA